VNIDCCIEAFNYFASYKEMITDGTIGFIVQKRRNNEVSSGSKYNLLMSSFAFCEKKISNVKTLKN
jgi:hypothetical protein